MTDPFTDNIRSQYQQWLQSQEQMRSDYEAAGNGIAAPLTEVMKLEKYYELMHQEFGGYSLALAEKATNPQFQKLCLEPMLQQLKQNNGKLDLPLRLLMMLLVSKAQYKEASTILAETARYPERYLPKSSKSDVLAQAFGGAFGTTFMKMAALESLGYCAKPGSAEAQTLIDALKDPFLPFQMSALKGISAMGELNASQKGDDRVMKPLMDYVQTLDMNYTPATQSRMIRDKFRYQAVKALDSMGGTAQLLSYVKAILADPKPSPTNLSIARSVAQALMTNGRTPKEIQALGFDPKMVGYFSSKDPWLGLEALGLQEQVAKLVPSGEHAHFDVAYVTPIPSLKQSMVYPDWIEWSKEANWGDAHPTGTADTFRRVAPVGTKIYSYNINDNSKDDEQPAASRNGLMRGLEDITQKNMTGETHVTTSNHSYGYPNRLLYSDVLREQIVDLSAAWFDVLGETGVMNFVSVGNSQGEGIGSSFEPIGTQNTLGSRVSKTGVVTKLDSTVVVAATDGILNWLAEFSSLPNPLRLDSAISMLAAPGYQEMTWYKDEDGQWVQMPINGTSFSSPNLAGLCQLAAAMRKGAKKVPWTRQQQLDALIKSAKPIPGRQPWEGLSVDGKAFISLAINE